MVPSTAEKSDGIPSVANAIEQKHDANRGNQEKRWPRVRAGNRCRDPHQHEHHCRQNRKPEPIRGIRRLNRLFRVPEYPQRVRKTGRGDLGQACDQMPDRIPRNQQGYAEVNYIRSAEGANLPHAARRSGLREQSDRHELQSGERSSGRPHDHLKVRPAGERRQHSIIHAHQDKLRGRSDSFPRSAIRCSRPRPRGLNINSCSLVNHDISTRERRRVDTVAVPARSATRIAVINLKAKRIRVRHPALTERAIPDGRLVLTSSFSVH